jgi:hypothetical protein
MGAATLSAQAPGAAPKPFPEGSGVPLPAGTRFVVQMHFNFINGRGASRFAVQMWRAQAPLTQIPHGATPLNVTFDIPAGARDTMAQGLTSIVAQDPLEAYFHAREGVAWDVFPHMHMIGRDIEVDLLRADGSRACLVHIPNWDFHWQGSYRFREGVPMHAGDQIILTCHWDNSPEHQPIVNGVRQAPREVRFGEGSLDEMCVAGVVMTNLQ